MTDILLAACWMTLASALIASWSKILWRRRSAIRPGHPPPILLPTNIGAWHTGLVPQICGTLGGAVAAPFSDDPWPLLVALVVGVPFATSAAISLSTHVFLGDRGNRHLLAIAFSVFTVAITAGTVLD